MSLLKKINLLKCLITLCVLFSCENKKASGIHGAHQQETQAVYTCSMHPQIVKNAPGSCPICGMELVKKEDAASEVVDIAQNTFLKPSNAFVISGIPVTTTTEKEENTELDLLGTIAYDTRQLGSISSKVSGRIERLYLRYKYQKIVKGQKVMDVYSPELMTAQQNLLFLLKNDSANYNFIQAAKDRLLLLGMSVGQIRQVTGARKPLYAISVFSNYSGFISDINNSATSAEGMNAVGSTNQDLAIKEGMYLQKGQIIFSVYNTDKVWILLNVFPEQQSLLNMGDPVKVVAETAPEKPFRAKIDYIEPVFRPENKTLIARLYFNNASMQLPIGSRVTATVFGKSQRGAWLPKEAVLSLGRDKIVFLKIRGGFQAKQIMTGKEMNNTIQVLDGLSGRDSVATNAQFLVDNEAFIKAK